MAGNRWRSFDERFESYIERSAEGCWIWKGPLTAYGYGQINRGRKVLLAHRVSYEKFVGPIPDGYRVCHHCDNPPCVRPDHLFTGTQGDNVRDCVQKGRHRQATPVGEGSYRAKISVVEVREIRAAIRQPGETTNQFYVRLGLQYGLTRSGIRSIVLRQAWKAVA